MKPLICKEADMAAESYLEKAGFEVLFPDGAYFADRRGRLYEPETPGLVHRESETTIAVTEMDTPRPQEDVFHLFHLNNYCGRPVDISFVNLSPRPGYYKSAVLSQPIACWRDHLSDGTYTLYSVLMLKTFVKMEDLASPR